MNNLSWFIYFVQVCDNIGALLIVAGVVTLITPVLNLAFTGIRADRAYYNTTSMGGADDEARREVWRGYRGSWKPYVAASVALFMLSALLPSRQTLLLIAGSEIGERVATSDAVKGVVDPGVDLLKSWIKKETDKIKKDS